MMRLQIRSNNMIFNKYPYLIAEIGVNFYDIAQKEGISDILRIPVPTTFFILPSMIR